MRLAARLGRGNEYRGRLPIAELPADMPRVILIAATLLAALTIRSGSPLSAAPGALVGNTGGPPSGRSPAALGGSDPVPVQADMRVALPVALSRATPPAPVPRPSATPAATDPAPPTATDPAPPTATPRPSSTPDWLAITRPDVPALALGSCSADIHDRFVTAGPDGHTYRGWHPVTVTSGDGECEFAHEHGAAPDLAGFDPPAFGYPSRLAGDYGMIRAHAGFKVFTHPAQDDGLGTRATWRMVLHQGTAGAGRLRVPLHEVQIDVLDSAGRRTAVRTMGDTGRLSPKCGRRVGDRIVPDRKCATEGEAREVWYTLVSVGRGEGRGAAFFAAPGFATANAMTHFATDELTAVLSTSELLEGRPLGDPESAYLGNERAVEHPDFAWGNRGPERFWTDANGRPLPADEEARCGHATCIEQRVPRDYVEVFMDDVTFDFAPVPLPLGAPAGN